MYYDDHRVSLGQHLVIVVQDGRGQVFEDQSVGCTKQCNFRGFLAGQAEHAQLNFVLARAKFEDFIGLCPGWQVPLCPFQNNVCSQPGEVRLCDTHLEFILPFVELVISKDGQIVAHQIVDIDGAFTHQQL